MRWQVLYPPMRRPSVGSAVAAIAIGQVANWNEDTQLSFGLVSHGWRLVFADQAAVYHEHADSPSAYLRRKWRYGYWRVRVYHRHPTKMLGDSYTPRSMQLQFLGALATICGSLLPRARVLAGFGAASFLLGTLPFDRQALPLGWSLAAATPALLFLRALALAVGLAQGTITILIADRSRPLGRPPDADSPCQTTPR